MGIDGIDDLKPEAGRSNVFEGIKTQKNLRPGDFRHPAKVGAQQIVAVFKGEDGSMGFKWNERYELIVTRSSIRRLEGGPWIPYESLEAFFSNWIITGSH